MKSFKSIILIFISLFFLNCNPKTDTNKANTSQEIQEANISEPIVTLSVLSTTILEETEQRLEQELANEFMELNPNIKIEFIGVPINHVITQITKMAIDDKMPDIFVNLPEFRSKLSELDITVDLSKYIDSSTFDKIQPFLMIEATVDNEIVFLPWSMTPMAVIYRKDWFSEKALTIPRDWESFLKVAKVLTEDINNDGKTDRWGFSLIGTKNNSGSVRFINILRSFGAYELRNENGQWLTDIDTPSGYKAMKYFGDLYTEHKVVPHGPIEVSYEEAVEMMAKEKVGMMITGSHSMAALIYKNKNLEGKLGSFLIPKEKEFSSTLGVLGYSISKSSKYREDAVKYLKFIIEKKNQVKWFQQTGRLPVTLETGSDILGINNSYSGFYKALNYVVPYPRVAYYADMPDILGQAYQSVLTESTSPKDAIDQAAKRIRQMINNSN